MKASPVLKAFAIIFYAVTIFDAHIRHRDYLEDQGGTKSRMAADKLWLAGLLTYSLRLPHCASAVGIH